MGYYLVDSGGLREFVREVFVKEGFSRNDSEAVADHLVYANLRGVDSHGVVRVPYYLEGARRGDINKSPSLRVLVEKPSVIVVDGDRGLGQSVVKRVVELCVKRASASGAFTAFVRRVSHVGMLAYYALMATREGMAGLVAANSPSMVAPWGGAERLLGTNPICFFFPYRDEPFILDMATSRAASFKIAMARIRGGRIPEGWAVDEEGRPTTDPGKALRGALLPFGEHKGYGLALSVELLAGVLSGAMLSFDIPYSEYTQGGVFIQLYDVGSIRGYEGYEAEYERLRRRVKSVRRLKGFDEVLLPGELEHRVFKERSEKGVPIDEVVWNRLAEVSKRYGVSMPARSRYRG